MLGITALLWLHSFPLPEPQQFCMDTVAIDTVLPANGLVSNFSWMVLVDGFGGWF
jgi:hypothetical protein